MGAKLCTLKSPAQSHQIINSKQTNRYRTLWYFIICWEDFRLKFYYTEFWHEVFSFVVVNIIGTFHTWESSSLVLCKKISIILMNPSSYFLFAYCVNSWKRNGTKLNTEILVVLWPSAERRIEQYLPLHVGGGGGVEGGGGGKSSHQKWSLNKFKYIKYTEEQEERKL